MPKCTADQMDFGRLGRCRIEANFEGGALSSDGGLMLLRQLDRKIGLSAAAASALHDRRDPDLIEHPLRELVAQRLYGLCCGYEDLNDHIALRNDPLMQTAVGTGRSLGSSATLCRMEQGASRADVVALNRVLMPAPLPRMMWLTPSSKKWTTGRNKLPPLGCRQARDPSRLFRVEYFKN